MTNLAGQDVAVVVPGGEPGCGWLTRDQLTTMATHFAETLYMLGLKPGDAIALLMSNRIEVPVVVLGARWAGIDVLPLSTHVPADSLAQLVATLAPKMLVASDDCLDLANQLCGLVDPGIVRLLATNGALPDGGWLSFHEMVTSQPDYQLTERLNGRLLLTSGGSTGLQKIVEPQVRPGAGSLFEAMRAIPAAARAFGFGSEHVVLNTGPLYHTMGASVMMGAVDAGAMLVIMQQHGAWNAQDFMGFIQTYGVTHTMMVPTMMARVNTLLDSAEPGHYDTTSLQAVVHGAAPCPESVKTAFMCYFPGRVFEAYGGTEGFVSALATPEDWAAHPGTVGQPLNTVIIRDEDGNAVPDGTPGIIWGVIAPGVMPMSYMGRRAETNECIVERDGVLEGTLWDIGYMEEGLLFISGRKKDMMIVGGANVYPIETENVLHRHRRVVDVAVVGIPHDTLGEVPAAVVQIIGEGCDELAEELRCLCRAAGLSSHAIPRTIVFGELPRTATGKMPKARVRELMLATS